MPKPYPKEFRDDVVRVARKRDAGVTLEQIAAERLVVQLRQGEEPQGIGASNRGPRRPDPAPVQC